MSNAVIIKWDNSKTNAPDDDDIKGKQDIDHDDTVTTCLRYSSKVFAS